MYTYEFFQPKKIEDVCRFLKERGESGRLVAGGTDLMVQMKEQSRRWANVKAVMDITPLEGELRKVTEEGDMIRVGVLCTHTDLENNEIVKKYIPSLGVACSTVGSPQIRNRGTVGGAVGNASPASDPLTPLIAYEAQVEITGPDGIRYDLLQDLYAGKGKLKLAEGEFMTSFLIKKPEENSLMFFEKLGRRKALAISRLNACVILHLDTAGKIDKARIAPGCVFVCPERVLKAEEMLIGKEPSEELFVACGQAVSKEMIDRTGYRWSTEYKKPALEAVIRKALCKACGIENE